MAKKRKRFTPQQRAQILSTAKKDGLTAKQVKAKFGVSMVTYYLWRRKAGLTGTGRVGRGLSMSASGAPKNLEKLVRSAVRQRIQAQLPGIVREEVKDYLDTLLSKAPGRRGRKRA